MSQRASHTPIELPLNQPKSVLTHLLVDFHVFSRVKSEEGKVVSLHKGPNDMYLTFYLDYCMLPTEGSVFSQLFSP